MRQRTSVCGAVLLVTAALVGASNVKSEDVTVGGYVCGEHQTARVYYPNPLSGKFPLISFAHGFQCGGTEAYADYSTMLTALTAAGYVVIVSESSNWPFECSEEWKDQLRSMEWARASNFSSHIDFTLQTGVLGHSMGGGASYHTAGLAVAVKEYNIGAAVALHPQIRSPFHLQPITNSLVPIFFGAGSEDEVVSPASVKKAYSQTTGVPKVFVEIDGAFHDEPMCPPFGKARYTPYVIAMFDCHLKGDNGQCRTIYGSGSGTLCGGGGKVKMMDCEHAHGPPFDVAV